MHIHILGVCGTFMGGLALIARQAGYRVSGCDADVYPPMSTQLADSGIELVAGYGAEQLECRPDLWVIGNVVSRGNALVEAILERGDRYTSGPQWLAENILATKWVLAVAGTHGKTSTSAMLAWILEDAGLHPGYLIGGVPRNFNVSARLTDSPLFVVEADEYDTAFFDKRPKFLHYRPKTAILNNLEFDHADIFADLAAIERQFHYFVRTIPRSGLVISNGREPTIDRVLASGCWTPIERFGVQDGWQASGEDDQRFEVSFLGRPQGEVRWELLGTHNRLNALAAIAAARHVGVPPVNAVAALSRFQSVRRRLEIKGTAEGVTIYDDFAHHPSAIATTIEGLRRKVGDGRILAVFEPRSNTMKIGVMKDQLAPSLAGADRVYCYSSRLEWDPREALAPLGARLCCENELDALVAMVAGETRAGDHVLIMSNGGFGGIHAKLLERIRSRGRAC